jgi:N-acetyl-gamma-glutamyl-phosphate reductase
MKKMIKTGIIGGAGYTGGELIRLLLHHPYARPSFIHSRTHAGKTVSSIHQDLIGDTDMEFAGDLAPLNEGSLDVLFLCMGHGESKKFLAENSISANTRIIDLSQDFRPHAGTDPARSGFVYGLPELNREKIRAATHVANPGCFATAVQLGLLPLASQGWLNEVYATGITGSTGAGQGLTPTSHFSWRANNIQSYKSLTHQHLKEIHQSLHQLQPSFPDRPVEEGGVNFVPWRGDFTRGIFITSMITMDKNVDELIKAYKDFYEGHPFTFLSQQEIFLKQVVNTNKCVVQLEKVGSKLVVHSVIDNLLKGASGQAVQNMNLMFGFDECAGLQLKATAF